MREPSYIAYEMAWTQVRSLLTPTERAAMDAILRECEAGVDAWQALAKTLRLSHDVSR